MFLTTEAILGSFTFLGTDAVEPGSDSGWQTEASVQKTKDLGADRTTILELSRGSEERSFSVWLPPDRYTALHALWRTTQTFTDWTGDTRTVYVQKAHRQQGSRPFLVKTLVELVEQ